MATFTIGNFSGLTFQDQGLVTQSLQVYGIAAYDKVTNVVLGLGGISHTFSDDLDMVLSSPDQGGSTDNLVFWSDVGSSQQLRDTTVILRDDAFGALLDDFAPSDAAYRPNTYGTTLETASDFGITGVNNLFFANGESNGGFASAFGDDNPNGVWTLRVRDDAPNDTGSLEGWSLTIETQSFAIDLVGTTGADTIRIDLASYDGTGTYRMNDLPEIAFSGISRYDIDGGAGADTIFGSAAQETIRGGTGRDVIRAGGGRDLIYILEGQDTAGEIYDGGAGIDEIFVQGLGSSVFNLRDDTLVSIESLFYGYGDSDDTETVQLRAAQFGSGIATNASIIGTDNSDDTVANKSDRLDIVMDTATTLDLRKLTIRDFSDPGDFVKITGDGAAEKIYGTGVVDMINAAGGNDILDGGIGADVMTGGTGDDTYYVDNSGDRIVESSGQGTDTVSTSVTYVLEASRSIDVLQTTDAAGTAPLTLTGNQYAQTVRGNAGNNTLDGKGGADTMIGLGGDDLYYVYNAGDVVVETSGKGTDAIVTSVSYALTAGQSVEFLQVVNPALASISLTGNAFAQRLVGNDGANVLEGGGGADKLFGLGGADRYVFRATTDSAGTARDSIGDFRQDQNDVIDLSLIDANAKLGGNQAFDFLGTGAFTGVAGQLRYQFSGADTLVQGDTNGDRAADFVLVLTGNIALSQTSAQHDFVL